MIERVVPNSFFWKLESRNARLSPYNFKDPNLWSVKKINPLYGYFFLEKNQRLKLIEEMYETERKRF